MEIRVQLIAGRMTGWLWRINVGDWFRPVQEHLQVGTRRPEVPSRSLSSEDLLLEQQEQ